MQKEPRKVAVSFGVDLVEIELKIKNLHNHFAIEYLKGSNQSLIRRSTVAAAMIM